jgi:hypothetical protein
VDPSDELIPSPETVLLTLARVGLYETDSGVVPAWEATRQATPRRTWLMAGAVLLTIGMGFGGYRHAVQVQGQRLTRAQELSTRLAGLLDSGSRADLRASEADFQQLFELDSRGQEPALLWLKNRALYTLLDSDPVSGIESAMQRARTVGIEEQRLVFGRLASALAAGDLPGAGQIISEWDGRSKSDAMYQLLAGAIFERAGNPEALERFTSATLLQPDLKLAHLMAARLAMLQVGPTGAKAQLELAYSRLGPGPATQVLRGLEWAASPVSDPPIAPPPVADSLDDLPPLLHATASAVQAVREQREGRLEEATEAFKRALGPTTAPAMAAWIGYQALEAGDIEIARAAALKAMQLSALHKNAQALAARIALSDGRLQAAQEAVRGLEPSSRDAVLIEAVSAYENLQGTNVERLVSGLPLDPTGVRGLKALHESANVILGQSRAKGEAVEQLAAEAQVWGALIAIDLALDQGQLEFADGLIQARGWDGQVAAHGARLMRLRRYQGQLGAALELVAPLLDANETTPRMSAEVILSFVDAGRAAAAASSLGQVGAAAGPLTPWLEALVEAARGRQPSAVQSLKSLDLPSKADPLLVQVVALRALALSNDRRARGYFAQLAKRFPAQPDVQAAGKQLGLVR